MAALGGRLALVCDLGVLISLQGGLGAGKTTLVRGFLHALGYEGAVKSPTYSLVEPYEFSRYDVYHFDFYRLTDPLELEYMGVQDYFQHRSICLVEWPDRAKEFLPDADITIAIQFMGEGRRVELTGHSEAGRRILSKFEHIG